MCSGSQEQRLGGERGIKQLHGGASSECLHLAFSVFSSAYPGLLANGRVCVAKSSGLPLFRHKLILIRPCLGAACSQLAVGRSGAAWSGTVFSHKMLDTFSLGNTAMGQRSAPTEMASR